MIRREEPIPAVSAGLSYIVMTGVLLAIALPPHGSAPDPGPQRIAAAPVAVPPPTPTSPPAAADVPLPAPSASTAKPAAPAPTAGPAASVPASEPASPAADPPPVVEEWAPEEIVRAKEQCNHLLASVSADVEWLAPIKKGACGLPQPVRLKRVNGLTFDPPVQVNCRMVAALGTWEKSTLQPNAQERLNSRVVRIVGASGYACRNIYHRLNARLSQHALANAIDIAGFRLADGRTIRVLKGWGLTARDIKARKAKAEAAKAKAEAKARIDAEAKAKESRSKSAAAAAPKAGKAKDAEGPRSGKIGGPYAQGEDVKKASLTLPQSSKPGTKPGPAGTAAADSATALTREAAFLRAIHGGACGPFGTVLGPEANDPHRDHFHLDLIPRRGNGYCR